MKLKRNIIIKFLCLLLVSVFTAGFFSGCSGSDSDTYIYINISEKPTFIDPQIAKSDEELMIVRNIFEGLLRKNNKGEIVCGVCESYNKNGLVYTFNLKKDLVWSDNTPLTANDFVFAFKRAVTNNVEAPFVNRLFAVKNAKSIYSGKAKASSLGVKALDDYTLKITLAKEDKNFLDTLTTSICMPCNQAFFNECGGKYGLDAENIISNGSYYLKKWNPDEFGIRLLKNQAYKGSFTAKNGAVFISSNEEETAKTLFQKEITDVAFVKNEDLDQVKQTGTQCYSLQNICWFLSVGKDYEKSVRKSLLTAVSEDSYKDKLGAGFSVATSLYPGILNQNKSVGKKGFPTYNLKKSMEIFSDYVASLDDRQFPSATLYYYDNPGILPAVRGLLGHWQQNLCAFVNITPAKNPKELVGQLKDNDLQFALFPVKATSENVKEYLLNFKSYSGNTATVQQKLLENYTLYPIAFENTNICYRSVIKDLYINGENGYIDFSFATKS